jgi:4-carboxymuconolactone decarboxylase
MIASSGRGGRPPYHEPASSDDRRRMDGGDGGATRSERGMRARREVLGDAHVDAAESARTELDADFQDLLTELAWGGVWDRPGIDRRTRSLVTIAILAALGRSEELAMHLRATHNTGATLEEVRETLLHVAIYAGIPAAHAAFEIAKRELGEAPPAGTDA